MPLLSPTTWYRDLATGANGITAILNGLSYTVLNGSIDRSLSLTAREACTITIREHIANIPDDGKAYPASVTMTVNGTSVVLFRGLVGSRSVGYTAKQVTLVDVLHRRCLPALRRAVTTFAIPPGIESTHGHNVSLHWGRAYHHVAHKEWDTGPKRLQRCIRSDMEINGVLHERRYPQGHCVYRRRQHAHLGSGAVMQHEPPGAQ